MSEMDILNRRIDRERQARKQAEDILEQKAMELFDANTELRTLNEVLEIKISERTQDLEINQSRLTTLISNLHTGVMVQDEDYNIVLTNQVFCDLFNLDRTPESLIGIKRSWIAKKAYPLIESAPLFFRRVQDILNSKQPVIGEEWWLKDGRILQRDYIPIIIDNKYRGHLWQYEDVTAERRSHEALRSSEEKYRGIIENMELGLMEVDTEGVIVKTYPRFCEMVGYQQDELVGKNAGAVFFPDEFQHILEQQAIDRKNGKASVYECQMIVKGGERIWALISGAPIFDLDGRVIGSIGIHYDITYSKKMQIALEDARKRAEAAQEAEKQFLANMSHEIRTPLNAIIGMSHLLYDTQPTEQQKEFLSILKNSAEMLQALISDVLDLSKVRAGKVEVQQKTFDLVGLVRSLVKSAQLRLEERPLSISVDIDSNLETLLIGDDLLLNQILSNLIGNAEKFTSKGTITVVVKIQKQVKNSLWLEFKIADTGIGIPKDKQGLIFQSFRQVDGDIKRKFGGTGLGLAIVKQLVELQRGSITVKSILHKGTTFTFKIPYKDSGIKAKCQQQPLFQNLDFDVAHKKVLIVEDNYMNRRYISTLFEKWEIDFKMAHNGREGVEMAQNELFDLILMDIQMPEMDGYEATINIRNKANANQQTPIIALTASAMLTQKDKAFTIGMDDYVSKPFNPTQLLEKLSLFLSTSDISQQPFLTENFHHEISLHTPLALTSTAPPSVLATNFAYNPRLDADMIAALYGDDYSYAAEMFKTFLKVIVPDLPKLKEYWAASDWEMLGRLAHKVKPTFSMVGLTDIEKLISDIEKYAKNEPDNLKLNALLKQLDAILPEAIDIVKTDFEKMSFRK